MATPQKNNQSPQPSLIVKVKASDAAEKEYRFTSPFRIGRAPDCEVHINHEFISRNHATVHFENGIWRIRDLNSGNGIYVGDQRVAEVPIKDAITIRLGIHGPELTFNIPQPVQVKRQPTARDVLLSRYAEHYFGKEPGDGIAGEHTMFIRTAFAHVQKEQKRRYGQIIALLVLVVFCIGSYAFYEHNQLKKQRAMATELFYAMKTLDLDIASLQDSVKASRSQQGMAAIREFRDRRRQMEGSYDKYLSNLHVYSAKMSEQDKLILRIARIFGECELDMPSDFTSEVSKYIKYWQSSVRLEKAIKLAQEKGYTKTIPEEMLSEGLPPQFFYLALQESDFDAYASGPATRSGYAKGMWQFVPPTALKYGLHLGPLVDMRRPDPLDDRHHYDRETVAAGKYLKDLYSSDAQASGLLVMACYNWGENQVLPLVRSMPLNPRERNFWMLLQKHRSQIPQETYDYVFYIVSAAVIGENPRLFGFNFDNPLAGLDGR